MAYVPGLTRLRLIGEDLYEVSYLEMPQPQRGTVTIANPDTSATVTLTNPAATATYFPLASVVGQTGSPAVASRRVYITGRATSGFTINVEATPGVGATVIIAWWMSP